MRPIVAVGLAVTEIAPRLQQVEGMAQASKRSRAAGAEGAGHQVVASAS